MKDRREFSRLRTCLRATAAAFLVAVALPLAAQDAPSDDEGPLDEARRRIEDAVQRIAIPRSRLTDGPHVRAAFRSVVSTASHATVRISSGRRDVALGGIVGPDGWIVTKASALPEPFRVRLRDGREFDAAVVGVDEEYDLAMLKIDARRLPTLDLSHDELPVVGRWVATVAPGRDPFAVGVVSVGPRSIPKQPGILGVQLEETDEGQPLVVQVVPDSGAARAGILVNDVIAAVNGKPVETREELIRTVREYSPDDEIEVTVIRDGQEQKIQATLSDRVQGMGFDRGDYQNSLGGRLSRRRYGFPAVFQHDTVLQPDECGGPLVDLDGRVVGFNIARAGRTESYALPTSVANSRLFDLMSGRLAPQADGEPTQAVRQESPPTDEDAATGGDS